MRGEEGEWRAVEIVPADACEVLGVEILAGGGVVREDGVAGLLEVVVAECACWGAFGGEDDGNGAEEVVVGGIEGVEFRGGGESVSEDALAAEGGVVIAGVVGGVVCGGMGEEVEELQAGGLGEVGVVGVEGEIEVSVRGVDGVDFGGEIPELAVVGVANRADAGEEGFRGGGRGWGGGDEGYAVSMELG